MGAASSAAAGGEARRVPTAPRDDRPGDQAPKVMHFDEKSSARDGVPNLAQLQALDAYFAWRREQRKKTP